MAVKLIVAMTDRDWFEYLRRRSDLEEVNFWSPSPTGFQALQPGELYLFKLHRKDGDLIVGGGIFGWSETSMPLALAWEAFGEANGAANLAEMRQRVLRYRDLPTDSRDPIEIGCRILTQPFFWPEHLWLSPPASWSPNIVRFKTFAAEEAEGRALWEAVLERSTAALAPQTALVSPIPPPPGLAATPQSHYGEPMLMRPRLGQGGFRLMVTGLYERKCAVTRERTLPALEAAHIRPYSEGGAHTAPNGILLRRDVHSLFDQGYVTVTPQFTFEVSRRIKQEFENGREYYALHGREVKVPDQQERRPDTAALRWHNEERYLG